MNNVIYSVMKSIVPRWSSSCSRRTVIHTIPYGGWQSKKILLVVEFGSWRGKTVADVITYIIFIIIFLVDNSIMVMSLVYTFTLQLKIKIIIKLIHYIIIYHVQGV